MANDPLILAIDQGTTSSRALVFDSRGDIVSTSQREFPQHYPRSGWVEHDPEDIWDTTLLTAREAMQQAESSGAGRVVAIGITNQRETTLAWNRDTGKPVHNAIVWQDRRTADLCATLSDHGLESEVSKRTGLTIDPYFSGTKLKWLLQNCPEAQELSRQGRLAFGTVDSFLIFRLTGGRKHLTDETNASRTLLYNILEGRWDERMIELLGLPADILPDVLQSTSDFGTTDEHLFGRALPIMGVAGDQQAAAFGQACWKPGMIKSTYGTGCFLLASTGDDILLSQNGLLSTVACRTGAGRQFALEGSIFVAGAVSQWLRDELRIIETASQTEALSQSQNDNHGVYMVPAFTGLGAPHWDSAARGTMFGLTRNSDRSVIARAALESVAYQTRDLIDCVVADGLDVSRIRVDGGMVENNWFLQFLSDILETPIDRPEVIESTARGAAFLAGLGAGVYSNLDQLEALWHADREFRPTMESTRRKHLLAGWEMAVKATLYHANLGRQTNG